MQNQEINKQQEDKEKEASGGISIREYFSVCLRNWYWFVISIVACTAIAYIYAISQPQKFESRAYILIKSDKKSGGSSESNMFSDLGIGNRVDAAENEIYTIMSTSLLDEVVDRLGIDVIYYDKKMLRWSNIYKHTPISVTFLSDLDRSRAKVLVEPKSAETFEYKLNDGWKEAKFGTKITEDKYVFTVTKTNLFSAADYDKVIWADCMSKHMRAVEVRGMLNVQKVDKETNVLELLLQSDNYDFCKDILDNLILVYNEDAINDNERMGKNTEQFIVDRISALSKDLGGIDSHIENLKISNNIPDVQAAAGQYVSSASSIY
jgi:tyrosine-protein kinase Etk/Wzc